ncbi:hypothetical protein NF701_02400 [Sphingomonadaceae bacterium OTU29THOMA1]|nr:hypothetical protein NF701_02400 [Sphingomonadaceae bacterium OTU29THOMA1]
MKKDRISQLNDGSGPIYAAIAGVRLIEPEFEVLPGVSLRQTYVYVFSHRTAAFKKPTSEDEHHPGPWKVVDGASEIAQASVEIVLSDRRVEFAQNAVEGLKLVAGLIRLLSASPCFITAVSERPLTRLEATQDDMQILSIEPHPRMRAGEVRIDFNFVFLLRLLLQPASIIFQDEDVAKAFALTDGVWWLPTWTAQMLAIWTAAEILIRPEMPKGKNLASGIRKYIGRSRTDGDRKYNQVLRLYETRGGSAHAGREPAPDDLEQSFNLVREVFIRALHEGRRPPLINEMTTVYE